MASDGFDQSTELVLIQPTVKSSQQTQPQRTFSFPIRTHFWPRDSPANYGLSLVIKLILGSLEASAWQVVPNIFMSSCPFPKQGRSTVIII